MTARQDAHLTVEQDLALMFLAISPNRRRISRAEQRRIALQRMADQALEDPHVRSAVTAAIEHQIERAVKMLTEDIT